MINQSHKISTKQQQISPVEDSQRICDLIPSRDGQNRCYDQRTVDKVPHHSSGNFLWYCSGSVVFIVIILAEMDVVILIKLLFFRS